MSTLVSTPFETKIKEYDQWFDKHKQVYESEIDCIYRLIPHKGNGVELGVNTGRFSSPLGIKKGAQFYSEMNKLAQSRGIEISSAEPDRLPYGIGMFDYALTVDIAYLQKPEKLFKEAHRILKPGGHFVVAIIDKKGAIGRYYQNEKSNSPFYSDAVFYTVNEVNEMLHDAGFRNFEYMQTLFEDKMEEITTREAPREGFGEGSFVVIRAAK